MGSTPTFGIPAPLIIRMEIRRILPGDEERVLAAAALFDRPPHPGAVRAFLADVENVLLLAYLSGQPAGFVRAHRLCCLDTAQRQMFLYEIGVAPAFRRQGIGRALIERLKDLSREHGCEEVFVITNETNRPAMALYAATGGERPERDDVVFVYPLPPPER